MKSLEVVDHFFNRLGERPYCGASRPLPTAPAAIFGRRLAWNEAGLELQCLGSLRRMMCALKGLLDDDIYDDIDGPEDQGASLRIALLRFFSWQHLSRHLLTSLSFWLNGLWRTRTAYCWQGDREESQNGPGKNERAAGLVV